MARPVKFHLVDAAPAVAHAKALVAKGMTIPDMVKNCPLGDRMVRGFAVGQYAPGRPILKCTPKTLETILAIEFMKSWDPKDFVPEKFRALRDSRGIARYSLAKAAGVACETIQYWETGRSLPTRPANLEKVLAVLGAGFDDVTGPLTADQADDYQVTYVPKGDVDYAPDYPCHVCGIIFRSRRLLATHPHPKKAAA